MPLIISIRTIARNEFGRMPLQASYAPPLKDLTEAIIRCARALPTNGPLPQTRQLLNELQLVNRDAWLTYRGDLDRYQPQLEPAIDALHAGYTADAINARAGQLRRSCPYYLANRAIRGLNCAVDIALGKKAWRFNVPEEPVIGGPGMLNEGLICVRSLHWSGDETTIRGSVSFPVKHTKQK